MCVSDLSPGSVEPLLLGRFGRPYRFVAECASTQRLLEGDETEGTTVATNLQTQGRGRLGRSWEAPAGRALLFSVLLRPTPPMPLWPELSLVAGDAVATALRVVTGVDSELRHPNDVLVDGRKLAGILAEAILIADRKRSFGGDVSLLRRFAEPLHRLRFAPGQIGRAHV